MNSSPHSGPLNRARQSNKHLEAKLQVGAILTRSGFEVMYEFQLADVVGFHLDSGTVVAVEVEMSPKNVRNNLNRNLKNGFQSIVIVVPAARVEKTVELGQGMEGVPQSGLSLDVVALEDLAKDLSRIIAEKI